MKTIWEYDLPTDERIADYEYESPIFISGGYLFYISESVDFQNLLHRIDIKSGRGSTELLKSENLCLPCDYFFVEYKGNLIIYAGDIFIYSRGVLSKATGIALKGKVTAHLLLGNRLIMSCDLVLCCFNLDTLSMDWKSDISNSKRYQARELSVYEDKIACYGKDKLLFINRENGRTEDFIQLPRIDKLFCPIKTDDENMLIGYTNWTTAGILKYNFSDKKIIWKHKRKFEGPQLRCRIWLYDDMAFWVKNNTELIALDIENGSEIYQTRTAPWLYTDIQFLQDVLIYGTAGADGFINCVEAKTGRKRWSVFLKNGCAYYDVYKDSVIVGDFDKTLKRVSLADGTILQSHFTGAEVVGRIKVSDGCVYTVIWENSERGVRLVKVQI